MMKIIWYHFCINAARVAQSVPGIQKDQKENWKWKAAQNQSSFEYRVWAWYRRG
jgi:uncharacterized protein YihD (DUF1040 family)